MSKRRRPRACASTGRRRGRGRALLGRVAATLALLAVGHAALAAGPSPAARAETTAGPVTFTFGGQLRLRYENDEGFTIKGYEPGGGDELLLTRVRLDLAARLREGPRFVLQLQDARAFLTRFDEADFPASSPIEDTLDVRQLHVEWLRIGGSPFGLKVGRQQISYGDQRVFGPGNWGNTGRFAWDAAMLKLETKGLASDLWVGKPLTYRSDVWPNRPVEDFRTLVSYTEVKRLPFRLDLFYVLKSDDSGAGTAATNAHSFVEVHRFALDEARDAWYTTGLRASRRDPSGRSGRALGDELDARVVWNAGRGLELMAGIGHFRPGEFVKATGLSGPATWTFAQAAWSW